MKTKIIIATSLLLAFILPVQAQKRKAVRKAPVAQPVVVEETPAQRLFKTMLPATAKVLFVDSIVVEKADFIKHIPLSKQAGSISTYEQFFNRPVARINLNSTVFPRLGIRNSFLAPGRLRYFNVYATSLALIRP